MPAYSELSPLQKWKVKADMTGISNFYRIDYEYESLVEVIRRDNLDFLKNFPPVKKIGASAFNNIRDILEFIRLPDTVTIISSSAFYNCYNLREINIPDSIKIIDTRAFLDCKRLEKVVIGENSKLSIIEEAAFSFAENLKEIRIPDSVDIIGNAVFRGCTNLENVYINRSIIRGHIGDQVFVGTKFIENIIKSKENFIIGDTLIKAGNIETIDSLPSIVTRIAGDSFKDCSNTKTLILPDKIEALPMEMFPSLNSIEDVSIPDTIEVIPYRCFADCTNLKNIRLSNNLKLIGEFAFQGCQKLKHLKLPESLLFLDSWCFENCGIQDLKIPKNVKLIADNIFGINSFRNIKLDNTKNKTLIVENPTNKAIPKIRVSANMRQNNQIIKCISELNEIDKEYRIGSEGWVVNTKKVLFKYNMKPIGRL